MVSIYIDCAVVTSGQGRRYGVAGVASARGARFWGRVHFSKTKQNGKKLWKNNVFFFTPHIWKIMW